MQLLKETSNSLINVLYLLSDDEYTIQLPILEQQTIGQQVRHIIEHWQILQDNYSTGIINYANRKRDKNIESNKSFATNLLIQLQRQTSQQDKTLSVVSIDEKEVFTSSYYRELDYVTEHLIHHAAIIKMAVLTLNDNIKLPLDFGYAPSTISHKQQQCVQ